MMEIEDVAKHLYDVEEGEYIEANFFYDVSVRSKLNYLIGDCYSAIRLVPCSNQGSAKAEARFKGEWGLQAHCCNEKGGARFSGGQLYQQQEKWSCHLHVARGNVLLDHFISSHSYNHLVCRNQEEIYQAKSLPGQNNAHRHFEEEEDRVIDQIVV